MNDLEERDPVWNLLEKAPKTEVSPAFAQNLVREVRKLDDEPFQGVLAWFSLRWGAAVAGAIALILGGFFLMNRTDSPATAGGDSPEPIAVATPYEEITIEEFTAELDELAYMSTLLEVPDTSLLADEDLAALLF